MAPRNPGKAARDRSCKILKSHMREITDHLKNNIGSKAEIEELTSHMRDWIQGVTGEASKSKLKEFNFSHPSQNGRRINRTADDFATQVLAESDAQKAIQNAIEGVPKEISDQHDDPEVYLLLSRSQDQITESDQDPTFSPYVKVNKYKFLAKKESELLHDIDIFAGFKTLKPHIYHAPLDVKPGYYNDAKYIGNQICYLRTLVFDIECKKMMRFDTEHYSAVQGLSDDEFWNALRIWKDWMCSNSYGEFGGRTFARPLTAIQKTHLRIMAEFLLTPAEFVAAINSCEL